jgi:parallel beta-helix repeat protein
MAGPTPLKTRPCWTLGAGQFAPRTVALRAAVLALFASTILPDPVHAATSTTVTGSASDESASQQQSADTGSSPFVVHRVGDTYHAISQTTAKVYSGTLKFAVESAVNDLNQTGGGRVIFTAGVFDLGPDRFEPRDIDDVTFEGKGMDETVIQNSSSAPTDTEPFDMSRSNRIAIRDMSVRADGPLRSTSDAIDFDGGSDVLIERVKILDSRGRGIVLDGKDSDGGTPRTADWNTVRDCVIDGTPSDGIELLASSNSRIEGCTITNVGGHGIQITKSSPQSDQSNKKSNANLIIKNIIDQAGQDGLNVTSGDRNVIDGNTVTNSSDDVPGRDGIRITSSDAITCDNNVVKNNRATDTQAVKTQKYGLNIASPNCHGTVVVNNDFAGNRVGPINDAGTYSAYLASAAASTTGGGADADAPVSSIRQPGIGKSLKASKIRRFKGMATDGGSGLAVVEIALRQTLENGCKWWNGSRFVKGGCNKKRFKAVTGLASWSYTLSKRLKPSDEGNVRFYTLYSRATDAAGKIESAFKKGRNANRFEVT